MYMLFHVLHCLIRCCFALCRRDHVQKGCRLVTMEMLRFFEGGHEHGFGTTFCNGDDASLPCYSWKRNVCVCADDLPSRHCGRQCRAFGSNSRRVKFVFSQCTITGIVYQFLGYWVWNVAGDKRKTISSLWRFGFGSLSTDS